MNESEGLLLCWDASAQDSWCAAMSFSLGGPSQLPTKSLVINLSQL